MLRNLRAFKGLDSSLICKYIYILIICSRFHVVFFRYDSKSTLSSILTLVSLQNSLIFFCNNYFDLLIFFFCASVVSVANLLN